MSNKLRVFTWHIHGSYLYYLTQADVEFYLPKGEGEGYGGRAGTFPWGENVHEIPIDEVKNHTFDIILFQHRKNYLNDQYEILSEAQRNLPKIYLEHDPPQEHPTDTKHFVDDPQVQLVHVTHFNQLMWDNNRTPSTVIEHGVMVPEDVTYTGEVAKGLVVVNNLGKRGRRLGLDVFETVRGQVPLELVGMGATDIGGSGEVQPHKIARYASHYRFFFNPIRYTSLGLAVCEAMMVGLPIVGLATTEMATVITNGKNGYIATDPQELIEKMQLLLDNPEHAKHLSRSARQYAQERFGIERFARNWEALFATVAK
ncbi:glycosyltransferase family 4 protein [Candidatus Saccharibacteria bacterium]|nr:glycosyltransferase family 4 protein [Candidatus Saccharibacteria bacterium]